ncbi:YbaK/EbsC family protein [Stappia sp. ES.058]|uniref:YbaK/EbsC family protein n=1 Tax=Stappia sp. ES.058 TaxID=1881061 RepID=UPI00087AF797|nr:YbaK/EbsC family protein [Stappia sp. ES.058]SDU30107.1 Cys-tRNA(Pro) deacylase, prolyl-tRNA editing enzyme YbaK/EbsC [Stappia sp. ES.058]
MAKQSSSDRVVEAARKAGLDIEIVQMPASTRTAEEAAAACGCCVAEIVKSLVYLGAESDAVVLLLVSGVNRVDEAAVGNHLGEALTRPNGRTVRERTGFAIGGVAPLGHIGEVRVFIDEDLAQYTTVWAAGGAPNSVFQTTVQDLCKATGGTWLKMTG